MSDDKTPVVLGKLVQRIEPGTIYPWTIKGILANVALALLRIAAALERIDQRQRHQSDDPRNPGGPPCSP